MVFQNLVMEVVSLSMKLKINTRSLTKVELVGADDMIGKVLWTSKTLNMQGFAPAKNILFQDNQSAMLLESKGLDSAGKCMRHLDVRYFYHGLGAAWGSRN